MQELNRLNDTLAGNSPLTTISKSKFDKKISETIKKITKLIAYQNKIIDKQQKIIDKKTHGYRSVYNDNIGPIRHSKHSKHVSFQLIPEHSKKGGKTRKRK
jgi:hypothetical protein